MQIGGDAGAVATLLDMLDEFLLQFDILTPGQDRSARTDLSRMTPAVRAIMVVFV